MANIIRLRLLRSGLLVAFIYVLSVHARFLKEALTELTDPQWGENLDEPILLSSTQNGSNSPVLGLETHEIKSDAPFTFAACMLVMDDNKILPEWLAYHYQVLPLRRLILATDPYSVTSPKPILDAYQQHLTDLNISLWKDSDYHHDGSKNWERVVDHPNATSEQRNAGFVWRQAVFYTECALQLQREGNNEWVIIVDSDEYISYNFYNETAGNEKNPPVRVCKRVNVSEHVKCRTDGVPANMMRHFGIEFPKTIVGAINGDETKPSLPTTIAHFIHKYWNDTVVRARDRSNVCDVLPRVQLGVKTPALPIPPSAVPPSEFDVHEFRTMSHREHNEIRNDLPGKAMLNLKNWNSKYFGGRDMMDIHRGTQDCFNAKMRKRPDPSLSFFRVHHYTGYLHEFLSRPGDSRRTAEAFAERNDYNVTGNTNEVTAWLTSFAQQVGPQRALYLTQGLRQWAIDNDNAVLAERTRKSN